jgi:hypothetical protein
MSDTSVRGAHAPGGVAEARQALLAWVNDAGGQGRSFLQVRLLPTGEDQYEIRHIRDVHRSLASLSIVSSDPYTARDVAQVTNAGEHRPLKTAPNLRQGWALVDLDGRGLWTALDYLYPACAVHWHAGRAGTLRVTHWRETAARQSGIYSAVGLLADDAVRDTAWACCDDSVCLRHVAWEIDSDTPLRALPERSTDGAVVPCPEPCSLFVSLARKTLSLERSRRQEVPGLAPLGPAEVEQIREIVTSAAAGTLDAAAEGDFAQANNLRRIRYLAARLQRAAPVPEDELPCEGMSPSRPV